MFPKSTDQLYAMFTYSLDATVEILAASMCVCVSLCEYVCTNLENLEDFYQSIPDVYTQKHVNELCEP